MREKTRGFLFAAVMCVSTVGIAQTSTLQTPAATPAVAEPCKPSSGSVVGVITGGDAARKLCRFGICLPPKPIKSGEKTCPPAPAPVSKPTAPVVVKELCPPGTTRIEKQPYCTDGTKLVDVVRVPVVGSSTAAPANVPPGQPAR